MAEIEYSEADGKALLTTSEQGEWIESNSIVLVSDWS